MGCKSGTPCFAPLSPGPKVCSCKQATGSPPNKPATHNNTCHVSGCGCMCTLVMLSSILWAGPWLAQQEAMSDVSGPKMGQDGLMWQCRENKKKQMAHGQETPSNRLNIEWDHPNAYLKGRGFWVTSWALEAHFGNQLPPPPPRGGGHENRGGPPLTIWQPPLMYSDFQTKCAVLSRA